MQRHRFYAEPSRFTQSAIVLDPQESHHLVRVLRLGEGDHVFVFDGEGTEWECEIIRANIREVELTPLRRLEDQVESPSQLTLAQALIKGDKFDWVVQKSTELGVKRIVPLITDHSDLRDLRRGESRTAERLLRWRRIALEALKQCGRRKLVEITAPAAFTDFCQNERMEKNLIFSERHGLSLGEAASRIGSVGKLNLWVAPEGGWSEGELHQAESSEFIPIHLGPRILRTETAAIAAVILAQYIFGDLK